MGFLRQSDEILTVGEFSRRFKMLVKTAVPELWLSGEISNLKTYSSGHTYFTLKDADASISAVLFRGSARAISFPLREGMKIFAFGEISLYEQRGNYQIIVRAALPDGAGDLAAKFNALKAKLSAEGLFDPSRKKEIPSLPKNIAVITSPTGAAVQDFCRILTRRGWRGNVWILPSRVQGAEAAAEIVERLKFAQSYAFDDGSKFDLAIVMRGGGSLEDLWSFNEEIVARAVADCSLPTISAVGHEIDFTLSDFAADLRAETPSAAAEYVSSSYIEATNSVREVFEKIERAVEFKTSSLRDRLSADTDALRLNSPLNRISNFSMWLDEAESRLSGAASNFMRASEKRIFSVSNRLAALPVGEKLSGYSKRLNLLSKQLEILGVENTLKRGFSLATDADGVAVSAHTLSEGDAFNVRFADGEVSAKAEKIVEK